MQLSLKVGGNFIDIGPTGVTIMGTMVLINSGGAAGSGAGSSPTDPETPEAVTDAKEADIAADAEPGEAAEMPPPKHQRKIKKHSPAALQFIQAAQDGKPFCAL
jgi:type VI secretion system secreted protein VgrG